MFPDRYFNPHYFAPRYFPRPAEEPPTPPIPVSGGAMMVARRKRVYSLLDLEDEEMLLFIDDEVY